MDAFSNFVTRPEFPIQAFSHYPSPVVSRERFADMVGLPPGVIIGWCNKGLVPQVKIGKYTLISIELLRKQCLAKEFA
ncbi:hypothetical protein [Undibacterium sp. CCC3.4]|uniref:hypothetical protein n=1 Tax=Undibacterium sp. CCC3.4 TaxID=3048609 RepID=UPI002AC9DE50|nr:hypothetical protein [Undibacterium sp. CCC3.4]WPX43788.1 hypothetical protein RHM61_00695 [Undibacterium sp. CCC3.4]